MRLNIVKIALLVSALSLTAAAQKVNLSWTASANQPCGQITAYNVYRSNTPGGEVLGTNILGSTKAVGATLAPTTYIDTAVTFGQTWFYKVTAFSTPCGSKESAFSNETQAAIPAQIIIIPAPTLSPAQVQIP